MAPRWNPPDKVGDAERLGRRIFDEPSLAGAIDQPSFDGVELNNFEEDTNEFSLDRLGSSGNPSPKVVAYLVPRAQAHGRKFHKEKKFDGWFHVSAKELQAKRRGYELAVAVSRIDGDGMVKNEYHCHAILPDEDKDHRELTALHLRHLFTKIGKPLMVNPPANRSLRQRFVSFMRSVLRLRERAPG
jgi:hypothetical protein